MYIYEYIVYVQYILKHVCMYVSISIHIYVYTSCYLYLYMYVYINVYISMHDLYIYIDMCLYICTPGCMCVFPLRRQSWPRFVGDMYSRAQPLSAPLPPRACAGPPATRDGLYRSNPKQQVTLTLCEITPVLLHGVVSPDV